MKKICLLMMLLASAQLMGQRSVVKTSLTSWAIPAGNVTYEYSVGPKISVGMSVHLPFSRTFDIDAIAEQNDGETFEWTGELNVDGVAVTPHARLYTGTQALNGFYLEVFMRYYNYTFVIPYDYDKDGGTIMEEGEGDANGFGGGLVVGGQIALGPAVVLDIYAGLGLANGSAHVETPDNSALDADDFADIAQTIEENKNIDVFLFDKTFENIVPGSTADKAFADVENELFPILRGGISVGYMF